MNLLIITPDLFGIGGVQRFSKQLSQALAGLAAARAQQLTIFSLVDNEETVDPLAFGEGVTVKGFRGNKLSLIIKALILILKEPARIYAAHLHFAPIAFLLKTIRPALTYGVHLHGVDAWHPLPFYRQFALRKADFITSSSRYTAETAAASNKLDLSQIRVLHPPVDPFWLEQISLKKEDQLRSSKSEGKLILSVARLSAWEQQKGIDLVIQAMPGLCEEFPGLKYVIIGSGDDLPRLKSLAEKMGVLEQVDFLGNVSDGELSQYYRLCDLFIMPSKKEGLGIVFLEAMAYGKPVIAGDHCGSSDAVLAGETGLLVPYGDVPKIQQAAAQILGDPRKAALMGKRGKQHLLENFTYVQFVQKVAEII
jgi:phosphatidylinositol alpha-1,6-mannosyltransferase